MRSGDFGLLPEPSFEVPSAGAGRIGKWIFHVFFVSCVFFSFSVKKWNTIWSGLAGDPPWLSRRAPSMRPDHIVL